MCQQCLAFFTFIPPDTPSQIVKISCPHTKVFAALTEARRHGTTKHICHTNHTPHNQKYILQETQLSQTGRAQHLCKDRNATSSANIHYFYNVLDLEIFKIAQTTFNVAFPRYRQFYWTVPLALIILLKMINNHIKKKLFNAIQPSTTPPHAPQSSRFGSVPPSVEDDVDIWRYAIVSCMPEMTTTTQPSNPGLKSNVPTYKGKGKCIYIARFL